MLFQPLILTNIFLYIIPYSFKAIFPFEICKAGLIAPVREEEIKGLDITVTLKGKESCSGYGGNLRQLAKKK